YCARHEIAHERCGKVVLAVHPSERARLDELERRGRANGVAGLRRLDAAMLEQLEPHARAIDGLHSPNTGVVDFRLVAGALAQDVRRAGGEIATSCALEAVHARRGSLRLVTARGVVEARHAIFCAGAWADRAAVAAGAPADPRIVPFRGAYLRLRPERRHLVRALIYPVPDPGLPFLGVHLSRSIDGEVTIGPTALHARNAPSPGASASLAIARHVADEAERAFELRPGRLKRTQAP